MAKQNLSRSVKFQAGTLVKCKCDNFTKVGIVDHNSGADICWIRFYGSSKLVGCPESDVRGLTFKEFAWFRHPITGKRRIGKNSDLPVLYSLVLAFLIILTSFGVEGWLKLGPITIGALIIVVNYLGLRYNYIKRWV